MNSNSTQKNKLLNTILSFLGVHKSLLLIYTIIGVILIAGIEFKYSEFQIILPTNSPNIFIQMIGVTLVYLGILGFILEIFSSFYQNQLKFKKYIASGGILALVMLIGFMMYNSHIKEEIVEFRKESKSIKRDIDNKKIELENLEDEKTKLDARVNQLKAETKKLQKKICNLQNVGKGYNKQILSLKEKLSEKENSLNILKNEKEHILEEINTMYVKLEDLEFSKYWKENSRTKELCAEIIGLTKRDSCGISINVVVSIEGLKNKKTRAHIKVFDIESDQYLKVRGDRDMARFILYKGNAPNYTITLMNTQLKPFYKKRQLRYELYISSNNQPIHRRIF